jgi:hypothetical protein
MHIKWRRVAPDATADPNILRVSGKVSSIMAGNASSIMQREAGEVTSG